MTLKDLKNIFTQDLTILYPKNEIENFYFLLVEEKLNLKRIDIALNPNKALTRNDQLYFNTQIEKLKNETPIQYIIGQTEFYGLTFKLTADTLIPRPETEELVDWVVTDLKNQQSKKNLKILDIGTGSGCIAISLAKNIPNSTVYAYDISKDTLIIAESNNQINNTLVEFRLVDILTTKKLNTNFDIIVSNPPYVRNLEKAEIKKNVLEFEPHKALFVEDTNPLIFYNKIADLAKKHLNRNGLLYFEINQYLGAETKESVRERGFNKIELRKDIFNNDRMLKASI